MSKFDVFRAITELEELAVHCGMQTALHLGLDVADCDCELSRKYRTSVARRQELRQLLADFLDNLP